MNIWRKTTPVRLLFLAKSKVLLERVCFHRHLWLKTWPLTAEYRRLSVLWTLILQLENGVRFWRNCGAASVGEWYMKIYQQLTTQIVPYRDWKADVRTSSERIEELWVLYGLCTDDGPTLLVVTWQRQKQEYINYVKSVGWYRGVYSTD